MNRDEIIFMDALVKCNFCCWKKIENLFIVDYT